MQGMDQSRESLLTKTGASSYSFSREAIQTLPQGDNTEIDKIVLQAPGVNYDSAASNPDYHIRGEYANVQYRINGIVLPEGVSGLGPVIDAGFIGRLSLLTGTLPAEYGLRTAGVLDITSRAFSVPGGTVTMYGGSRETTTPSFDYGGSFGNTQYFVAARGNWNTLGIENPTPSINAIHDFTDQGKFFGYVSTLLNELTRLSLISGASYSAFQIPNNPDQTPLGESALPLTTPRASTKTSSIRSFTTWPHYRQKARRSTRSSQFTCATLMSTSYRISSVTWCSTTWPPTLLAKAIYMAPSLMPPTGLTQSTHCAQVFS